MGPQAPDPATATQHASHDGNDRVKMECPTCGYKSFPQWLNNIAHCLKCDAVLKTRPSCNHKPTSAEVHARRLSGEVSTHKEAPSSAMESDSGACGLSPSGIHHWKFGKCNYCHMAQGQIAHGAVAKVNPGGKCLSTDANKCMFNSQCPKCGCSENGNDSNEDTTA